jgi:hypothetical protein
LCTTIQSSVFIHSLERVGESIPSGVVMDTDNSRKDSTIAQRVRILVFGDEAKSKEERWLVQKLGTTLSVQVISLLCFPSFFFSPASFFFIRT